MQAEQPLTVVVVGASGDLAKRKILPSLFSLYCQGLLPAEFNIFGFARSEFTAESFRTHIRQHLTCRYVPQGSCATHMDEFLARCHYVAGAYDSKDAFLDLFQAMQQHESTPNANRLFYLAIPPSIFMDVARAIGDSGMVRCGTEVPWSRVVIEKPFGRDRPSSDELTREMANVFTENQTFRIDHYLGKEVVQNLQVLRFANLVFEPIWNKDYIESVQIVWQEDLGVEGRGGYFDTYGIIRDVIQNHLLQILALVAMERPRSLNAHDIRDEKVRLLRRVAPVTLDHVALGQYTAAEFKGKLHPAYRDDSTAPLDSLTPTLAAAVLHIDNPRWKDVPFMLKAGKGLNSRLNEIRIRFRAVDQGLFCSAAGCPTQNELTIRIQPDESIYFTITSKVPGLDLQLDTRQLDLRYEAAFSQEIPDAYESLILDVIQGEKSLFIRNDELAAAWDIFTPILHEIEDLRIEPEPYPFGSNGPDSASRLAAEHGVKWH